MNKKITIYTLADRRPEFIPVQFESIKKYAKDDFEYIVINNAIGSRSRRNEISKICGELGIKYLEVKRNKKLNIIGGQKAISLLGYYTNPNVACAYPIKLHWSKMIEDNKDGLFIIIDSDMFLCNDISFEKELNNYDLASIMQYRGLSNDRSSASVSYLWNAFCVFDPSKQNLLDLNWDCGLTQKSFINNYSVDVGGYTHFWLKEKNPKIKHITEYAIMDYKINEDSIQLVGTLNGCYAYSFSYNKENKKWSDYKVGGVLENNNHVLPKFPNDFKETLIQKTISYFEKFLLEKNEYPNPSFIGFIEFESFNNESNNFIIHMKAGSGYMGFGMDYYKMKFDFIKNLIGIKSKYTYSNNSIQNFADMDFKVFVRYILKKAKLIK